MIPTNDITGFLGVGKTTAILNLLKQKPANERWAVLVNEFGEVGVDGSLFAGTDDTLDSRLECISVDPGSLDVLDAALLACVTHD